MLYLARDAFERLMGPAEKVLAERIREYETANSEAAGKPVAATQASSRQVSQRAEHMKTRSCSPHHGKQI